MPAHTVWQRAADMRQRFGWQAASLFLLHSAINRFVFFDCLDIIVLERSDLRPLPSDQRERFGSRLATRDDLVAMYPDPQWHIGDDKLRYFDAGDECVLSLVDGQVAGYTWVHAQGRPELIEGLSLSVPRHYLYNYAGLTKPDFRGAGLQSLRHHSVLNQPAWADRQALLGYVRHVNYASKKGQGKSGYRKIGTIWMLGSQQRYAAWLSPAVRKLGITRATTPTPVEAERTPPASQFDPNTTRA